MRKITLLMLVTLSVATINSFAGTTKPLTKAQAKCAMKGGSCCKQTSRAALMMKAKPVKKA